MCYFILQAYEKCFQNLHYMQWYEEHTIAHVIQAKYENTKVNKSGCHTVLLICQLFYLLASVDMDWSLSKSLDWYRPSFY